MSVSKALPRTAAEKTRGRFLCFQRTVSGAAMVRRGEAGFTLLELILVLAVMTMVTSLGIPSIARLFDRSRFKGGVADLQTALAGERLSAMRSGEVLLFRCRLGTGQYEMVSKSTVRSGQLSDDLIFFGGAIGTPSGFRSIGADTDRQIDVSRDVRARVIGSLKTPDEQNSAGQNNANTASPYTAPGRTVADGWSQPILFYPNGHTSSAALFLASSSDPEPAYFAEVSLRGMTGMVRISAISPIPPGEDGFPSVLSREVFDRLRRDEQPRQEPEQSYGVVQEGTL